MSRYLKLLIVLVVGVMSLSGCGLVASEAENVKLQGYISEKEVRDYYAKAMEYDSVVTKNIDVARNNYELRDVVNEGKVSKLKDLQKRTENALTRMEYDTSMETYLSEGVFNYLKAFLNDKRLVNASVSSVKEAVGHYFIDVEYNVEKGSIGTFKDGVSLLGINGAYYRNYDGLDKVDNSFLNKAVKELNDYYRDNKVPYKAAFSPNNNLFVISNLDGSMVMDYTNTTISENRGLTPELRVNDNAVNSGTTTENNQQVNGTGVAADVGNVESKDNGDTVIEDVNPNVELRAVVNHRLPGVNVTEFEKIVGSSKRESAYVPKLNMVYNIPYSDHGVMGIGLYPSGSNGLGKFGFNVGKVSGTCRLRYVYKDDIDDPNKIIPVSVYVMSYVMDSGVGSINADTNNGLIIPEFVKTEIEKLIERSDRAIINNDISALMSGQIYRDTGMAVLTGYERNFVNVLRQMSTFRRLIARDIEKNSYVVEVETLRQEGPKDSDIYGTYIDTSYYVIEQLGDKFFITDWYRVLRETKTEPDIRKDKSITKRLVALNLAGPVKEESKEEINQLMSDLYLASTNRLLYGPKEVEGVEIKKGMYDCFNKDVSMLPSTRKEYINSELREQLIKRGVDVKSVMTGNVVTWIGGASNQVEFISEETIEYSGYGEVTKMEVYYLVSKMEDEWVIDERNVIDITDVTSESGN